MNVVTFFILMMTLFGLGTYGLIRNDRVYRFRNMVLDGAFNYLRKYLYRFKTDEEFRPHLEEYEELRRKVYSFTGDSYCRMVLSFKPLTLENWYSPEEIKIIREGLAYYYKFQA